MGEKNRWLFVASVETILADVIEKHGNSKLNKTDIEISFSKRQTWPTNATILKYDGDQ